MINKNSNKSLENCILNTFNLTIPKNKYEKKFVLELLERNFFPNLSLSAIKKEISPGMGFIFKKENTFVGSITIDVLDRITNAFRLVVIGEQFRNNGFGKLMLSFAEHISFKNGYSQIYLRCEPKYTSFYQRVGFVETTNNEFKMVPNHIFMCKTISMITTHLEL